MVKSKRASEVSKEDVGMILDPMEVMKAMLAQKGKGKQVQSDDDESEDESEDDDENSEGDGSDKGEHEDDSDEEVEEEGSEAGSSRSAELRHTQKQSSPISRIPTSRVPATVKAKPEALAQSRKPPADTTFESLGLSKPLISALASINIKAPTEIQSACLGPRMAGRDCIGGAKTGSGKTLAFALPIVERIARDPFGVWAVVLTPTR